ncbi:MAG TPA: SAF domain-containing protein [Gaiellales bacterium]|nr:SAF domain-containing protein [Gaiellales bacterium]
MSRHRRRSVAFGALALVLALVALYGFGGSPRHPSLERMRRVVSMRRPVAPGQRIASADLATGAVPVTWANPHQLVDPGVAVGQLAAVALPAGAPLMDSELAGASAGRRGRDVSLRLDEAAGLPLDPPDGLTADLYLVRPGRVPRVQLVLADALVIASRTVDGAAVATLRVPARDVAALIQAESAGSLRLVGRSGP